MIIRERDKKQLQSQIKANEERILCIRDEIDDLESELSWREDDLDTDQKRLALMEGEEYNELARSKQRPKCEAKLTAFVRIEMDRTE